MRLPKRLRKKAIRVHGDAARPDRFDSDLATRFVEQHHDAIRAASEGDCRRYRAARCELMRLIVSGADEKEGVSV